MAQKTKVEITNFPMGTSEQTVIDTRDADLSDGAVHSSYTGSEEDGWVLTTVWNS